MPEDPGLHQALGPSRQDEISVVGHAHGEGLRLFLWWVRLPGTALPSFGPAVCPSPQLYDFTAAEEMPCAVAFHPTQQILACGFDSGMVRTFSLADSDLLVEHK